MWLSAHQDLRPEEGPPPHVFSFDAQLDDTLCDRAFAFPVGQNDCSKWCLMCSVESVRRIRISCGGGDPEETVPAAQPRVVLGEMKLSSVPPQFLAVSWQMRSIAKRLGALRQQHLHNPGIRVYP